MLILAAWASAADWPQFRGPDRSGISPETHLARSWPANGPKTLWTIDVGEGFGAAAVRDGEVYILDRRDDARDILRCIDLQTGKPLWDFAYDAPGTLKYNGSRNVPTVDEARVYTLGPFGQFHCLDRKTHAAIWSAHLVNDFKAPEIDRAQPPKNRAEKLLRAQVPEWGLTQSPLIWRDLLILAPQTQKVGVVAYEKTTGKIRWQTPYIGRNWYSHVTPTLLTLGGVEQIVMLAQPSDPEKSPANAPPANVCGIDPQTGQILWKIQTPRPYKIPVTCPVAISDDRLLITGAYGMGCLILKIWNEGGTWNATWISASRQCAALVHSPIVYNKRIYVTSFREHGSTNTGLVCLDADGQVRWQTGPKLQFDSGGYLIADDLVFIMHGKTGDLYLLEIADDGYRQLAKAKALRAEGAMVWAPLALSGGKLLVRDQHVLKCLDVAHP